MRIAYIIAPFESSEYLIRCINSIKRQTFSDYEIIVAENYFDESAVQREYLASVDSLRLISDKPQNTVEKIREAIAMASPVSVLIKLISVDTVAVPTATAQAQRDGDIIIAPYAEKAGDGYKAADSRLTPVSPKLSLYSLFLKKTLFEQLDDDIFTEKQAFELWMDEQIAGDTNIVYTDEICFYTIGRATSQNGDPVGICMRNKNRILEVVKKTLSANSVMLFDKYLSRLLTFLFEKKYELSLKNEIFSFIKKMGEAAVNHELAKRLYELYLEGSTEFIQGFDCEGYLLYMDRKHALTQMSFYQAALPKPAPAPKPPAAEPDPIAADVKALKNDIAALSKNMHFYFSSSSAAEGNQPADPYNQVPEMFSQGKLGMKVILKSIKGWLKYKFSRKKK